MRTKTKMVKNKEMNEATYKLRRRVMELIYEIKDLADIPRVEVRITDDHERVLGLGTMSGTPVIWITERAITASDFDLRTVVYHEVLHAVFHIKHDEKCPLMKATHSPLSKGEAQKHFMKWVKRALLKPSKTVAYA
jgi:hypothetical protein